MFRLIFRLLIDLSIVVFLGVSIYFIIEILKDKVINTLSILLPITSLALYGIYIKLSRYIFSNMLGDINFMNLMTYTKSPLMEISNIIGKLAWILMIIGFFISCLGILKKKMRNVYIYIGGIISLLEVIIVLFLPKLYRII